MFLRMQVYVSIISNAIVFPVNFLIAFLFKRSRRRKQSTSRVGDAVKRMRESQAAQLETQFIDNPDPQSTLGNDDRQASVERTTPGVRPSTASRLSVQVMESSTDTKTKTKTKKKVFLLPWWCSIISWILLWITVGVSLAFVTFYAIQFRDEKCKKWLTSLLIGFFSSVLLTQPIKVMLFALLYSVICKKPFDDEVDEEDLESQDPILQSDETWLHTPCITRMYDSRL